MQPENDRVQHRMDKLETALRRTAQGGPANPRQVAADTLGHAAELLGTSFETVAHPTHGAALRQRLQDAIEAEADARGLLPEVPGLMPYSDDIE